ncbi:hypothetical protein BLAHAN_06702 [Blautia hansenii DSM 20583]|uniref:Uncharacterized protein n=1 Tax=Blautia hansenii DSM 20583 TaxID=537007 RepID=C9LB94_BLAHA|nr:hypothetical protein BLAHAN_06702 [Blautia hansenii DSM 20583]
MGRRRFSFYEWSNRIFTDRMCKVQKKTSEKGRGVRSRGTAIKFV